MLLYDYTALLFKESKMFNNHNVILMFHVKARERWSHNTKHGSDSNSCRRLARIETLDLATLGEL